MLTAIIAGLFLASSAHAMYILDNAYEMKCALGMSKGLAKFTGGKSKCLTKCQQGARKAANPASDCIAPYAGTTAFCVSDPVKGVEAKTIAKVLKGCVIDCPECYSGGDCSTYVPGRVASVESQLDVFGPLIWCDDSGSGDGLTTIEAKCQDTVAKTLAKFVGSKDKCYDKCLANQFKGKIPPGYSCTPPATEPSTVACINLAESKAAASIDKACTTAAANPECYVPNFDTGAEWVAIAEAAVDANIVQTYCGSPSGAFVE
jgi:hypothetical protein